VLVEPADSGDEVAVTATVRAEGQVDVEVASSGDAFGVTTSSRTNVDSFAVASVLGFASHADLRGRDTSSPPQLGHTCSIASAQWTQKVHSNEQMVAGPSAVSAPPHRSHTPRISSATPYLLS
jgi:hypothetical protein